jgi:hypothetical protein
MLDEIGMNKPYRPQGVEWIIWAYIFWPLWIIPVIAFWMEIERRIDLHSAGY